MKTLIQCDIVVDANVSKEGAVRLVKDRLNKPVSNNKISSRLFGKCVTINTHHVSNLPTVDPQRERMETQIVNNIGAMLESLTVLRHVAETIDADSREIVASDKQRTNAKLLRIMDTKLLAAASTVKGMLVLLDRKGITYRRYEKEISRL